MLFLFRFIWGNKQNRAVPFTYLSQILRSKLSQLIRQPRNGRVSGCLVAGISQGMSASRRTPFSCPPKKGGWLPAGPILKHAPFFDQEVLNYLAMFTDPTQMKAADEAPPVHPLDTVMAAFKDDDAAAHTCNKLQTFLADAFQVQGKEFLKAVLSPAPWQVPNPHTSVAFTSANHPPKIKSSGAGMQSHSQTRNWLRWLLVQL